MSLKKLSKYPKILLFLMGLVFLSACGSTNNAVGVSPTEVPVGSLPTPSPLQIALPASPMGPTETNPPPTFGPPKTPTPFIANSIADFPGNLAKGETAPDFAANLTGGGAFSLTAPRSGYLLVFPTVAGCGDCMFGLSQIDWALIPYPDIDLQVLVLSIYSADDPAIWEYYKGFVTSPNFQWGVVASESFVVDYEVLTLGPVILVDPDGNIVFRIDHPMPAWQFEKLFELLLQ